MKNSPSSQTHSLLTDEDLYLFNEGNHSRLYQKLGSHLVSDKSGEEGAAFAVWAPDAAAVHVIGDFNEWRPGAHPLVPRGNSGVWEGFVPKVEKGHGYKYRIDSRHNGYRVDKADPFAVHHRNPPDTSSVVWDLDYTWRDQGWMEARKNADWNRKPLSIYEVHLGSWRRHSGEGDRFLSYRELAVPLGNYVREMGFTHVEFLPIMEHPFYGSWGYQVSGFFAPTSRYGTPQDFMALIDHLHQLDVGVILDWVPSHFVKDEHALGYFDGSHLFEHADPRLGLHPDWDSLIFNYGRNEVRSFLVSSAAYWLDRYHVDGLRVDAVASMLYRDYSREDGEWIPNEYGGRENLEAIRVLQKVNEEAYSSFPGIHTVAEESTAFPMVSRPTYLGGLGFGMKWDMGWMHDTLDYMAKDPIFRRFHHDRLTFRMLYSFTESFVLPLSHDEVVHGKGSLLAKMPGDPWKQFANLRLLFAYMYSQPGKKLLFMGAEIGQWTEWNHDRALDWELLQRAPHRGIQRWVADLNHLYRKESALHSLDFDPSGFQWVDCSNAEASVVSLLRRGDDESLILAVFNFTPVPRTEYRVGVPRPGDWEEVLNSDAHSYGGSGVGNYGSVESQPASCHGLDHHLEITLPPLGAVFFKGPAAK